MRTYNAHLSSPVFTCYSSLLINAHTYNQGNSLKFALISDPYAAPYILHLLPPPSVLPSNKHSYQDTLL